MTVGWIDNFPDPSAIPSPLTSCPGCAPSNPQRIGSPVIVGDHAYLVNEEGLAQCFELNTGKDLWKKERTAGESWESLVAAGDRLSLAAESGEAVVLAVSPTFKLLARNSPNELRRGSVAVGDGDLFLRTYEHLWCIRTKP